MDSFNRYNCLPEVAVLTICCIMGYRHQTVIHHQNADHQVCLLYEQLQQKLLHLL